MKKILCGALVLLAAVASFTSCKKDKSSDPQKIESIALDPAQLTMSVGDYERIDVVITPKGIKGTKFEWSVKNEEDSVVIIEGNGNYCNVLAYDNGEAIIICEEKESGLKAECAIKVCDFLETLDWQLASCNMPKVIQPLIEVQAAVISATGTPVMGYVATAKVNIFSKGLFYADGTGELTGVEKGAIITMPTYVAGITKAQWEAALGAEDPAFKETDTIWTYTVGTFATTDKDSVLYGITPTKIDNEKFMQHVNQGIAEWNKDDSQEQALKAYQEWWAADSAITGAKVIIEQYDAENESYYQPTCVANGFVDIVKGLWLDYGTMDYMYNLTGGKIQLRAVQGDLAGVIFDFDEWDHISTPSTGIELGKPFIKNVVVTYKDQAPMRVSGNLVLENNKKFLPDAFILNKHKFIGR